MLRISVLMGIYNCAATLPEALDSLYAQTYQDFKIILCDDRSKDDTYQVAKEYADKYDNIILIRNKKNIKLAATLNHCLKYADSEYIARMDGDDISLPDRFEKEIEFLDEHPEYAMVSCPMIHFDESGDWKIGKCKAAPEKIDFAFGTPFCHAPMMMRTDAMKAIGGYTDRKHIVRMEDYYLWYKLYRQGYKGYNLSQPLYKMRDDKNAAIRRRTKDHFYGIITDIEVLKGLEVPFWFWFRTLRNIAIVLMPPKMYMWLHKRRGNN